MGLIKLKAFSESWGEKKQVKWAVGARELWLSSAVVLKGEKLQVKII